MASSGAAWEKGNFMTSSIPNEETQGVVVPLVTPLDQDERVDTENLAKLVRYLVAGGVNGLFVLGSTGEFARLREFEKIRAIETVNETTAGKVPLYIGIGETGICRIKDMFRLVEPYNADFLVVTLPYYYKALEIQEQYSFFASILESTDRPIILYNIPENVGNSIQLDALPPLLAYKNLIGIKDSSGDMKYLNSLLDLKKQRHDWKVLCGAEKVFYESLLSGVDGLVPSMGNAFPRMMASLWEASQKGLWDMVKIIQSHILDINRFNLQLNSSLRGVIMRKQALELLNICGSKTTEPSLSSFAFNMDDFYATIRKYHGMYEKKA
ncbi:MAG: dihydrodipicolinate synthase family protein [Spirochaetales bacterium]